MIILNIDVNSNCDSFSLRFDSQAKDGYLIILLSSDFMSQLMRYCNNNFNLTNELENGKKLQSNSCLIITHHFSYSLIFFMNNDFNM